MAIEVEIKKWGNSYGVVIPKDILDKEGLNLNDKILINIIKKSDLSHFFGHLKRKAQGQKFKEIIKENEWEMK